MTKFNPQTGSRRTRTSPKVLAVASCGGHWQQLLEMSGAWRGLDVAYASVGLDRYVDVPGHRYYSLPDSSRSSVIQCVRSALAAVRIVWNERPDVVVSTGAAPGVLALLAGRVFGARTVWIDSAANTRKLSLSGRIAQRFAQLCLTQWPHLAQGDGPKYAGAVL